MKPLADCTKRDMAAKLDEFCISAMSPSDMACLPPEELDKALFALIILYQSTSAGGAIDNKIEQAMDLVKSHLLFAVREEVEVLKVQIKDLSAKNEQLLQENAMLRQSHTAAPGQALPPLQQALQPQAMPQQTLPQQQPTVHPQQPTVHPQGIPQQQATPQGYTAAQGQGLSQPPQGQIQAPSMSMPQQKLPPQQPGQHPQGIPQQQPTTAQLSQTLSTQQQNVPPQPEQYTHLQQQQIIPLQQQLHSIPGMHPVGMLQQSQHTASQQAVQHNQQQPPNT